MMVMTAKVDFKKILLGLTAAAALVLALILLFGGGDTTQTAAPALSGNDARVKFLTDFGWEVTTSPVESSQVKIPTETTEVFDRYNALQKSQGFDLTKYPGKRIKRYTYEITNYPTGETGVQASLLVYKNTVIGGEILSPTQNGILHGLTMPEAAPSPEPSQSTVLPGGQNVA